MLPRSELDSICRMPSVRSRRSTTIGLRLCRRAKVSNWRVRVSPRFAAVRIASSAWMIRGSVGLQPAPQDLLVAADDHQQIVEVVRDAAGQLPERLQLLRLGELLARQLQRGLAPRAARCRSASPSSASVCRRIAIVALSARLGTVVLIRNMSSSRNESLRFGPRERPAARERSPDREAREDEARPSRSRAARAAARPTAAARSPGSRADRAPASARSAG